ncbi:MAG: hypothetical protein ACK53E_19635 [Pseudanabaena sp.]
MLLFCNPLLARGRDRLETEQGKVRLRKRLPISNTTKKAMSLASQARHFAMSSTPIAPQKPRERDTYAPR